MSFARARMKRTIHVAPLVARDLRGTPTYGPARPVMARVEARFRTVRNTSGQEVQCDTWILTEEEIKPTDRIWLPGADPAQPKLARTPGSVGSTDSVNGRITLYEVSL